MSIGAYFYSLNHCRIDHQHPGDGHSVQFFWAVLAGRNTAWAKHATSWALWDLPQNLQGARLWSNTWPDSSTTNPHLSHQSTWTLPHELIWTVGFCFCYCTCLPLYKKLNNSFLFCRDYFMSKSLDVISGYLLDCKTFDINDPRVKTINSELNKTRLFLERSTKSMY